MNKAMKSQRMITVKVDRMNGWGMHRSATRRVIVGLLATLCAASVHTLRTDSESRSPSSGFLVDGGTP